MKNREVSKLAKIFDPKMIVYDLLKISGSPAIVFGYRTKKIYCNGATKKDLKGTYLVSSNHTSAFDIVVLLTAFPTRRICFLAAKEVYWNKVIEILFKGFKCIKVDRDNPSTQTYKKVDKLLKWGHPVVVFPEAKVNDKQEDLAFHKGIVLMAIMSNVPILPVYIIKRAKKTQQQKVLIGKKIYWKDLIAGEEPTLDEIEKITTLLKETTENLKHEYEQRKNI